MAKRYTKKRIKKQMKKRKTGKLRYKKKRRGTSRRRYATRKKKGGSSSPSGRQRRHSTGSFPTQDHLVQKFLNCRKKLEECKNSRNSGNRVRGRRKDRVPPNSDDLWWRKHEPYSDAIRLGAVPPRDSVPEPLSLLPPPPPPTLAAESISLEQPLPPPTLRPSWTPTS